MVKNMSKHKIAGLFVTIVAGVGLTTAQNSQARLSSAKPKPVQTTTKPLTKKSAMPPAHKSSGAVPASTSAAKTNAELSRLERQNVKAPVAKKTANPAPKPAATSNAGSSGINATYQKPKIKN